MELHPNPKVCIAQAGFELGILPFGLAEAGMIAHAVHLSVSMQVVSLSELL